jgi:hypothetical protein
MILALRHAPACRAGATPNGLRLLVPVDLPVDVIVILEQ